MKGLWNLATLWARPKPPVGATPAVVVHTENKLRLLRYQPLPGGPKWRTPILMVPSLINRHYVLDLMPGKSFAEYLVGAGHDVWVIDWGTPGDEDRFVDLDHICGTLLARAVRVVARHASHGRVHLLGYCMGGIFTAMHAALAPEQVASLCNLAAPVRFSGKDPLGRWTGNPQFDVDALVDATGNVPWQLLQGAFSMLRPTLPLAKAMNVVDRAWNDRFLDGFVAMETGANDNVSLPGAFFRRYIGELYRHDALVKGQLRIHGRPVRLSAIRCPTLAVVFEHDAIAPWQDCACLVDEVAATDTDLWKLPGSHVGGVVSRPASRGLWPGLSAWWTARD